MIFAKHPSDRRSRAQIRPRRLPEHRPPQGRRVHAAALVPSVPQHDARVRPALPALSSLTVKAAAALSHCAGHALPALLVGFLSWAVAEMLAGFAAYAEAMYSPPAPEAPMPGKTQATERPHAAQGSVSLMRMPVNDTFAGYSPRSRPDAQIAAPPEEWRGNSLPARTHLKLARIVPAWWSPKRQTAARRRAIAELRALDERTLRDIGICRCGIEHVAKDGARRE